MHDAAEDGPDTALAAAIVALLFSEAGERSRTSREVVEREPPLGLVVMCGSYS